jgi:hypothetical protein
MGVSFLTKSDVCSLFTPPEPPKTVPVKTMTNVDPLEHTDGSRTVFTLPDDYIPGTLMVFINGVYESRSRELPTRYVEIEDPPLTNNDILKFLYMVIVE